jgi:hypothetical protein
LPLLELRAFDVPQGNAVKGPLLRLKEPHTNATGRDEPGGLIVHADSVARAELRPVDPRVAIREAAAALDSGLLMPETGQLRMTADYRFESFSRRGCSISRAAIGRTEWKDETGRTLNEIQISLASAS